MNANVNPPAKREKPKPRYSMKTMNPKPPKIMDGVLDKVLTEI